MWRRCFLRDCFRANRRSRDRPDLSVHPLVGLAAGNIIGYGLCLVTAPTAQTSKQEPEKDTSEKEGDMMSIEEIGRGVKGWLTSGFIWPLLAYGLIVNVLLVFAARLARLSRRVPESPSSPQLRSEEEQAAYDRYWQRQERMAALKRRGKRRVRG